VRGGASTPERGCRHWGRADNGEDGTGPSRWCGPTTGTTVATLGPYDSGWGRVGGGQAQTGQTARGPDDGGSNGGVDGGGRLRRGGMRRVWGK
jgi:hypothetical protein